MKVFKSASFVRSVDGNCRGCRRIGKKRLMNDDDVEG